MTRPRLIGLFVLVTLFALLALCPLGAGIALSGLGKSGLSARAASGTIWSGTLADAQYATIPLGDVQVGLRPLSLLAGRAELNITAASGTGRLIAASGTRGIDNVTAKLALGPAFAPLPIDILELNDVTVRFAEQRCDSANGRIRVTFIGDIGGLDLTSGLSGAVRCAGDEVMIPLVSQSGTQRLTMHITSDNHWRTVLFLTTNDPAIGTKLTASGFRSTPTGYVLRLSGSL
jgi:general secretion pathway protein N